jgi:hypothetical protein
MQSKSLFRRQNVARSFAFGCAVALAGCASNGSVKASAQSQLVTACDKAQTAITLAGFFKDKMTAPELKALTVASDTEERFCSPSALAADLTPGAYSANIAALGQVLADMDSLSDGRAQ